MTRHPSTGRAVLGAPAGRCPAVGVGRMRKGRNESIRLLTVDSSGGGPSPALGSESFSLRRPGDFPVMTKRITYSPQSPTMAVGHRHDLDSTGRHSLVANGVGVFNDEQHAH